MISASATLILLAVLSRQGEATCPVTFDETGPNGTTVHIIPFKPGCRGTITSPGYPDNYFSSEFLRWRIRTGANVSDGVTVIQVRSLKLEPLKDIVKLIEENDDGVPVINTLRSQIDNYGRLVPEGPTFYRTQHNPNLTIEFTSDLEIEASGFNLSYAFDDCVYLEGVEHGTLEEILSDNVLVGYNLNCDEGYQIGSNDGSEVDQDSVPMIYCDKAELSATRFQWINNKYYCGRIVSGCTEHKILNGRLENVHDLHYRVVCDCELCFVIGPIVLMCVEVGGKKVWEELQDIHQLESPQCAAHTCATPNASATIVIIYSSTQRVPGSFYRERCINRFIPDITRWCLSTGEWTKGFSEEECY